MDATSTPAAAPVLRPATGADAAFLEGLFFAVRGPTFAAAGLPEAALQTLLTLQHQAQRAGYAQAFPSAVDGIIEQPVGTPVGRLLILREGTGSASHWRVLDLAVLPAHQGRGVASAVMGNLCAEADAAEASIALEVDPSNVRALSLYRRLGFEAVSSRPPVVQLRRTPRRPNGLGGR